MVNVRHFSLSSAVCLATSRLHIKYVKYGGVLSMIGMANSQVHSAIIVGNTGMKGEGGRVAAMVFILSLTEMVSLVGRGILKYASWSGISVVLIAFLASVDSVGFVGRAAR